jgi:hypothetical protein
MGRRPVRCIETNEIFRNAAEASRFCGLKQGDIIYLCCKGKQKTAGGYHWEYVNEDTPSSESSTP